MAKMFYTLEEAAEKLGVDKQQIKELASSGKLQQFRDRDKLMFKREQVDGLTARPDESTGALPLESGDAEAINLMDQSKVPSESSSTTGISMFDSGEVETDDPSARTAIAAHTGTEEGPALESVGSGSGLLDLTRESDDTSLGAELLEEIYPTNDESGTASSIGASSIGASSIGASAIGESALTESAIGESAIGGTAVGASGVFESALGLEAGQAPPSGLNQLGSASGPAAAPIPLALDLESADPTGSGLGAGLLLGATIVLVLGLIVVISGLVGVKSAVTTVMTETQGRVWISALGMLILCALFGGIGVVIGKTSAK